MLQKAQIRFPVLFLYQSAIARDQVALTRTVKHGHARVFFISSHAPYRLHTAAKQRSHLGINAADLLSCLQKSIRGSDPDAAIFYLGKLLEAGELLSTVRRLLVIAAEDIGLAYPLAMSVTHAACESAIRLGLPEGRIPLASATLLLATSPKSNAAESAIDAAIADIRAGKGQEVPPHLQSPLYRGYKYPHDYKNHYVPQQYLPKDLVGTRYYRPGDNKTEQAFAAYWKDIKK